MIDLAFERRADDCFTRAKKRDARNADALEISNNKAQPRTQSEGYVKSHHTKR